MAVLAPKLGAEAAWHPGCFVCLVCEELLVDLTHCVRDGSVYCGTHVGILRDQLTKLAAMTRGGDHDLATPAEALAVQTLVERILASGR